MEFPASEADTVYLEAKLAKGMPVLQDQDKDKPLFEIPRECPAVVSCASNADYVQRLSIKIGGVWTIFEGRGENEFMFIKDHPDQALFRVKSSPDPRPVYCLFEYNDRTGWKDAKIRPVETYRGSRTTVNFSIGSEDWSDNDQNDTVLTVSCPLPQRGGREMLRALASKYNFSLGSDDEDE